MSLTSAETSGVSSSLKDNGFGYAWYQVVNLSPQNVFLLYILSLIIYIGLIYAMINAPNFWIVGRVESCLQDHMVYVPDQEREDDFMSQEWVRASFGDPVDFAEYEEKRARIGGSER